MASMQSLFDLSGKRALVTGAGRGLGRGCALGLAEKGAEACPFSIDPGSLVTKELLLAFAALGVVAILPVIIQKLRSRKAA